MILLKNNVPTNKWESFISGNIFANPFQSHAFREFYNSVKGLSAEVFAVDEVGELLALCVVTFQKEKGAMAYFSRRAIIYGGPIIVDDAKGLAACTFLLKAIYSELKNKAIYIEIRNFNDYSAYKSCFISESWHYEPYLNAQIALQGRSITDVLEAMNYNRRRQIALSLKEGATFRIAENTEEITAIYYILEELYKKRVNLPFPSLEFFIKLFKSEVGMVFVVLHANKVIGGSFCFYYPGNSIYTMYYCGERNYHSKIFPTHLAIMAAIDFGMKNKLNALDLMGAGKPGKEYGVRTYKSEFGSEIVEQGRFIRICNPLLYSLGNFGLSIIKKLKK